MRIFDVSVPVSSKLPVYEGDPAVEIELKLSMTDGDAANVSRICMGVHTGTHVDAPNHFIPGKRKVHELDLEVLIGPCRVVEMSPSVMAIGLEHVAEYGGIERILFKTRNSQFWHDEEQVFRKDFTYIAPEAARFLADSGAKLVGIDYLSVEAYDAETPETHITLLEKEIVILEGLDLNEVPAGEYELISLPLKIAEGAGDGAPARTVLRGE
ncbi:MAG: cyclase family protein [Pyrinomonadaceae bacterium]